MSNRWSRYLSLFFSGSLALSVFGCGDDDGGGGDRPDARPRADAAGDPDAGDEGGLLRSGTIAITEAEITNPLGAPFFGALVRVGFSDATTGNAPAPVEGFEDVLNNCLIRVWDVGTHTASESVDEGVVRVTGTQNGDFACGFSEAAGNEYVCQSTTPAIAGGVAGNAEGAVVEGTGVDTLIVPDGIAAETMVGMYIRLSGFGEGDTALPEATFPITDVTLTDGPDTLTLFGVPDVYAGTGDADSTYTTFVGVGPVPTGAQFLGGAANDFTVQKAAGEVVGAIDEDFSAHGQGFALVDDAGMNKYLPHTIPVTPAAEAVEVNFECAGAGCGAEGSGGLIEAIVINGETTDAALPEGPVNPADPMPEPQNQYATFQCSFINSDVATLTPEMMAAILGTNPTRIQTSVGRYRGAILDAEDGTSSLIVLQGHALLGWSDRPAE